MFIKGKEVFLSIVGIAQHYDVVRNGAKKSKNAIGIAQYSGESRRFPNIHEGIAQYLK